MVLRDVVEPGRTRQPERVAQNTRYSRVCDGDHREPVIRVDHECARADEGVRSEEVRDGVGCGK